MKWVTRKRIHVNRTATGWLVRRFLDLNAEIVFVEPGEVAGIQERDGAVGFDAPGAQFGMSCCRQLLRLLKYGGSVNTPSSVGSRRWSRRAPARDGGEPTRGTFHREVPA